MKPEPSLIEALRWWRAAVQAGDGRQFALHLQDEIDKVKDARALYPTPHALGDRVSVVYPPEKHPEYEDFTGTVTGVEFHTDGVDYRVEGDGDPDYTVVDSAFVHPATSDPLASWFPMRGVVADIYAGMSLAELRMHEWSVDVGVEQNRCPACRAETKDGHRAGCLLHEAINARLAAIGYSREPDGTLTITDPPVVPPSWFPMDGRRVTEESPGEAPYKPVTDKARRESIARAVIRSKPGPEGGDCDIDYRAAALVLFNLLDDIDTLDDACREDDAAFRRLAMVKARRREDVGASFDGYTVAFIGEAAYAEGERRASEPSCAEGSPEPLIPDVLSCFDCEGHRVPEGGWLVRHTPTGATGHLPQVDIVRGSAAIGEWVGRFVDAATSPDGVDARFRADPATVAEVEYPANPGERVPVEVADADTDNPKLMFPPEASGRRLIFDDVDGFSVASWLYPDGHREPAGKKPELDAIPKRTGAPKNEYVCLLLGGNPLTRCALASGHEGSCVARDPDDKHTRFVAAIRAEFAATVRDGDVSYMRGRISAFDKAVEIAETIWTGE